jgi:hypothetical protein
VVWGEVLLLRSFSESAGTAAAPPSELLRNPTAGLVRAHVPAGRPIVYVTSGHGVPELFSYYGLSYALTPRNPVWWAADGRPATVVDWWSDASGGAPALLRLARRLGATYLIFAGRQVPADLAVAGEWRMDRGHVLVELGDGPS